MTVEQCLQPAPAVLASNALFAPSSYVYDSPPPARVLRDRSGNPQFEQGNRHDGGSTKADPSSPDENSPIARPTRSGRAKDAGFRIPATKKPRRVFQPRGNEEEFQFLWYRLYECERYRKYRHGYGGKDEKGNKVERWPLEHEEAFFRAVIRWAPVGRKKLVPWYRGSRPLPEGIKSQPLGRNELVALFINDWFGLVEETELIDRKKVSSHLQVLKSYFKSDPFVAWHLGGVKSAEPPKKNGVIRKARHHLYEAPPSMSTLPSLPPLLPHASTVLQSQVDFRDHAFVLQPNLFRMFIQDPRCRSKAPNHNCSNDENACDLLTLHTISESQPSASMRPKCLASIPGWQMHVPHLEHLSQAGELTCDVLLAESSLALAVQQIRNNCRLTIQNSFRTGPSMARMHDWQCRTQIFEDGKFVCALDDAELDPSEKQISRDQEKSNLLHVSFRSGFWAQKFHALANRLRIAAAECGDNSAGKAPSSGKDTLKRVEEEVRIAIKGITFMQEIFIVDNSATAHRRRIAIMYWKFRQTQRDEVGITTWRTLIPPGAEQGHGHDMLGAGMGCAVDGGLNISMAMNETHLPAAGVILPSQSSYDMQPQHDLDLLTSAALFDPGAYHFDALGSGAQHVTDLNAHGAGNAHPAVTGAEMHNAFNFDSTFNFNMPLLASSDTIANPLAAYDSVVLEGGVSDAFWSHNVHADNGSSLVVDHLYGLGQGSHNLGDVAGSFHQQSQHDGNGNGEAAQHHPLLVEHHQHFHHHVVGPQYADFDAALVEQDLLESWRADAQQQQMFAHQHAGKHGQQNVQQQDDDAAERFKAHYALQEVQQQVQQQPFLLKSQHGLPGAASGSEHHEQVFAGAEEEIDWEAIMPNDPFGNVRACDGVVLELEQQMGQKKVPALLPSAFES